jgi:hypothetical protein
MTPTERLAAENANLAARLELANESLFYAMARVRALEAQLGIEPQSLTP